MALTKSTHTNHNLSSHTTLSPSDNDFAARPPYIDNASSTSLHVRKEPPTRQSNTNQDLNRSASQAAPTKQRAQSAAPRTNRAGLFSLAAFARDRTSSAIATLTQDPTATIRQRPSSTNLSRQSVSPGSQHFSLKGGAASSLDEPNTHQHLRPELFRGPSSGLSQATTLRSVPSNISDSSHRQSSLLETNPPSQPYEDTDANTPSPTPIAPQDNHNKMHQTSSRLLRMTDDERPFTRVCDPL